MGVEKVRHAGYDVEFDINQPAVSRDREKKSVKETLIKSAFRRRTKYNSLIFMDSSLRGNDEF
jgi:hypothetical protein